MIKKKVKKQRPRTIKDKFEEAYKINEQIRKDWIAKNAKPFNKINQ